MSETHFKSHFISSASSTGNVLIYYPYNIVVLTSINQLQKLRGSKDDMHSAFNDGRHCNIDHLVYSRYEPTMTDTDRIDRTRLNVDFAMCWSMFATAGMTKGKVNPYNLFKKCFSDHDAELIAKDIIAFADSLPTD